MSSALVKKLPMEATLVDILVDGFEKNELLRGFHWRGLPFARKRTPNRGSARSSPRQRGGRASPPALSRRQPVRSRRGTTSSSAAQAEVCWCACPRATVRRLVASVGDLGQRPDGAGLRVGARRGGVVRGPRTIGRPSFSDMASVGKAGDPNPLESLSRQDLREEQHWIAGKQGQVPSGYGRTLFRNSNTRFRVFLFCGIRILA